MKAGPSRRRQHGVRRLARRHRLPALGLLLVLVLLLPLGLVRQPPALAGTAGGSASGAGRDGATAGGGLGNAIVAAGSFELAKVRILGVPVLTVASPVVGNRGDAPDAQRRAEVIEGNLRLLYDPERLCSESEQIAEWILVRVLGGSGGGL